MAKITTLNEMIDYIKLNLGYSVINVEVSNAQFTQIISDSVDTFIRYNYDEGNYRDYMVFSTSAGVDEYNLSGNDILNALDWNLSFGVNGINTLFSVQHTLLANDWIVKGNYPGAGNSGGGFVLADYQIGMTYLKEIENLFGRKYVVTWRPDKEVLKITPTPTDALTGILLIFRKEKAETLYNNILVKRLAIANSMILWGRITGKHNIPLPGGGTINGNDIKREGYELLEKALDDIKRESTPIDFFVG